LTRAVPVGTKGGYFQRERIGMRRLTALFVVALMSFAMRGGATLAADPPGQKFVVYFQEWSAAFDDSALGTIAKAADYAKQNGGAPVRVIGFADPTGSRQANVLMSELRAQVVVDQLVQDGIAGRRISQGGKGSVQFALTSQESRRVEITVGAR
jgi:outer membrane protein OmpA-like peptidoglycan-associated protein